MESKVPVKLISRIDVLVYPFYNGGYELATPEGKRKFGLWMKNLRSSLKERSTAFFIIPHSFDPLIPGVIKPEVLPLFNEFERVVAKLKRANLVFVDNSHDFYAPQRAARFFKKNGFSKNVLVRYYGQHVGLPNSSNEPASKGACVENTGLFAARSIVSTMLNEKYGVNVSVKKSTFLSLKTKFGYPRYVNAGALNYPELIQRLSEISKGKKSVFSLRPPKHLRPKRIKLGH